jgi:hypothetical protein
MTLAITYLMYNKWPPTHPRKHPRRSLLGNAAGVDLLRPFASIRIILRTVFGARGKLKSKSLRILAPLSQTLTMSLMVASRRREKEEREKSSKTLLRPSAPISSALFLSLTSRSIAFENDSGVSSHKRPVFPCTEWRGMRVSGIGIHGNKRKKTKLGCKQKLFDPGNPRIAWSKPLNHAPRQPLTKALQKPYKSKQANKTP